MFSRGIRSFGELSKASGHFLGLRNMASAGVSAVQHDEKRHKFFIPMESTRKEALLSYALPKNDVIDLQHTFVPDEFRGKGIAAQLVDKALDYAAEKNLKVQPTCWYVAEYVEKNKIKIGESPSLKKIQFI